MEIDGYSTYYDDHFVIYRSIKSPCGAQGANIVLQINVTSQTKSQKKKSDFWLPEVRVGGEEIR